MNAVQHGICVFMLPLLVSYAGCGKSSDSGAQGNGVNLPQGAIVLAVKIGAAGLCTGVVNQPCVSVTVCLPTTTQCQTISDILLDTGSVGLRIFRSVLTLDLS